MININIKLVFCLTTLLLSENLNDMNPRINASYVTGSLSSISLILMIFATVIVIKLTKG